MSVILRRLREVRGERGIALIFVIIALAAVSTAVTSVLVFSASSGRTASRSGATQNAYNLAEAGIASAMAVLKLNTNNALDPSVFCTSAAQASPCTTVDTYTTGTATWYGVLNQQTASWTLTSKGSVSNPTGPNTGAVTRTITATVAVHPTLTQPLNTPVWNYMYATHPASAVGTCDMTLANSVNINSPLYVEGNLCLQQTSNITNGPLVVKGRLTFTNSAFAGTSSNKINEVHILNGCVASGTLYTSPCPKSGTAKIWATLSDATVPTDLNPPTVDYNKWYLNGSPGPFFGCQTINGLAPISGYPTFDTPVPAITADDTTKLTYKNNNLAAQNLTPAASYRCQTTAGELSWNATTKVLTISGTMYIDGSLYISNGTVNRYDGQGVIYLSGTFLASGSSTMCGAVLSGACDNRSPAGTCDNPTGGWDPNCNLLVIVANGTGGQVSTGNSIQQTNSASVQGAYYAYGKVDLGQSAKFAGPIVADSIILGQSVSTNFPSITSVPNGMPANPTAYAEADPPSYSG